MKLLIVRHADPDYEADSLTPQGWLEARALGRRLSRMPADEYVVSPLGRAKATAAPVLEALGRTAREYDWLREFEGWIPDPVTGRKRIPWDLLPSQWTGDARCCDPDRWLESPLMQGGTVADEYRRVCGGLDAFLAGHGYTRQGKIYAAGPGNEKTVVMFCHFGVECVLLSHLCDISPLVLWHHFVALPSSVTVLATEERRSGQAIWRVQRFGDLSHLDEAGLEPSFAARFCETFDNAAQRHD